MEGLRYGLTFASNPAKGKPVVMGQVLVPLSASFGLALLWVW